MLRLFSDNERMALELDSRKNVYDAVQKSAGCHFREIQRRCRLPTGSVRHHLSHLVRSGMISEERHGSNVRYFPKEMTQKNRQLLALLRQDKLRRSMLFIMDNPCCSHEEVAMAVRVSPSTASWHMNKLKGKGVIQYIRKGRNTFYASLAERSEVLGLLVKYRDSFFDAIVDKAIELWDG